LNNKDKKNEIYKSVAPFINLGLQMAITIGVFVLAGWWLDKHFDTSPLWTLVLTCLGIFGSMYSFIRKALKIDNNKDNSKK
jgi:F0F1-type ATP synthase assembly protein I